jgi:hypothetical protein
MARNFEPMTVALSRSIEDPAGAPCAGPLPSDWLQELETECVIAMHAFADDSYENKHQALRVYEESNLSFRLNEQLLTSPRTVLVEAMDLAASGRPITLQLSDINRWNDQLTVKFAHLREYVPAVLARPANDFRLALFIGTGGHTAFGIHVDGTDKHLLHVPLTGGDKRMHLVDAASYQAHTGHLRPTLDLNGVLPIMTPWPMVRGRFLYFRGDWFHVGSYSGLSMSLILVMKDNGVGNLVSRTLKAIPETETVRAMALMIHECGADAAGHKCPQDYNSMEPYWANAALRAAMLERKSAGGFLPSMVDETSAHGPISRVAPFPILIEREIDGSGRLFARGSSIPVHADEVLYRTVHALNSNATVPLRALSENVTEARRIAEFLLRVRAVQ